MTILTHIFLVSLDTLFAPDKLPWVIGVPTLLVIILILIKLVRNNREMRAEMAMLKKVKRHPVEYELVLKTMKLSVWHIDVSTQSITYDSDFRESINNVELPQGTRVDEFIAQMVPTFADNFRKSLTDLMMNRKADLHEQYQMMVPFSDNTYWEETYATIGTRNIEGMPQTIIGTSLRIDQQKGIENALLEALRHAEESDRLKSAFLANISHEVRTPLNAIVGFSDILPMAQNEEERKDIIRLIKKNNAVLLRLFNNTVRLAKLESRDVEKNNISSFDVNLLLKEIVNQYAEDMENSAVKMIVGQTDHPMMITTERNYLQEILNQYVDNALNFTTEGSITLGYTLIGNRIRLWVRDTGQGIPEEKCNMQLFDRFVKADEFIQGTGLGLAICRTLAKKINGTVGVESQAGKGSCFWVEIIKR